MQIRPQLLPNWSGHNSGPLIGYWTIDELPGLKLVPQYRHTSYGFNGGRFDAAGWIVECISNSAQNERIAQSLSGKTFTTIQSLMLEIDRAAEND